MDALLSTVAWPVFSVLDFILGLGMLACKRCGRHFGWIIGRMT